MFFVRTPERLCGCQSFLHVIWKLIASDSCLNSHDKTIRTSQRITESTTFRHVSEDSDLSKMESGQGEKLDLSKVTDGKIESVPNCCAICLEAYSLGDTIAWSTTCQHAFHVQCIVPYLAKRLRKSNRGELPCPFCRQPFCRFPKEPVKSQSDHANVERED